MPLKVVTQPDALTPTTFTFVVASTEIWSLRTVVARVDVVPGGSPNRAYALTITDGTNVVSAFGAPDIGDEPGTRTITWANAPGGADAVGPDGVIVAPMVAKAIPTGYAIVGTITTAAAGDTWTDALVWCDYAIDPGG